MMKFLYTLDVLKFSRLFIVGFCKKEKIKRKKKSTACILKTQFFAQIGVLPNNPALTINDLDDVRQIDGLFRAHVLLAELAGRSSPDYKDYLIQAHTYLMRLWQVSTIYFYISL